MKKRMFVLFIMLLLTLALAVPASATPPTEVSGNYFGAPPQNRTWRRAGKNCIVEVDIDLTYDGDLAGTAPTHFRIVSHGPCGPNGPVPGQYYETIKARGTFTGAVLGESGTFDFTETAKYLPVDPGEPILIGRIVILSGTGELANLKGVLDVSYTDYSGQIHFDP